MARPTLVIDPERVLELARLGVPVVDVAAALGCHRSVLHRRFGRAIGRGRVLRKLALLEAQWKAVEAGDVRMLIWLGKRELGQSNKGPTRAPVERTSSGAKAWELIRALSRAPRRSGG